MQNTLNVMDNEEGDRQKLPLIVFVFVFVYSFKLTMFLRGYYYYLEKPTRCYHACLHVNFVFVTSRLNSIKNQISIGGVLSVHCLV